MARGARVVLAGGPVPGDGHFFAPVVLADVPPDARVMREEIFGPIVAIAAFDAEDEALALANDHDAGLAAYLFTSDLERAMRLGGAIKAGMVGINRGRVSSRGGPVRRRRSLGLRPLGRRRGYRRVSRDPLPDDAGGRGCVVMGPRGGRRASRRRDHPGA